MLKWIFLSLILMGNSLAEAQSLPAEAPWADATESLRRQYELPALAMAIVDGNQTQIVTRGVRKMGDATLVTASDLFHLGSCTKAMTASLLAIWIERGQLQWSSRLADIFPEVEIHPDLRDLKVEDLAAHRSGLTDNVFQVAHGALWPRLFTLNGREGRTLALQTLLAEIPATSLRSTYTYSNWNAILIGAVLEKVSGRGWEELIQKDLFSPLQMNSCVLGATPTNNTFQPWPHTFVNGSYVPLSEDDVFDNPPAFGPAGTVRCSLSDWGRFLRWQMAGARGENTPLLAATSFRKLIEAPARQEYTYGGWLRLQRPWAPGFVLHHTGSNTLNFANVWLAPALGKGFVAVTNAGGGPAETATDQAIGQLVSY
jgi:CubicO group peptidase (beta-lactamase class C family)